MTVYGTYGSSLQQGDLAPATAANAGQALAPYRTHNRQRSDTRWRCEQVDVSTAVFRLERPFANLDPADNVFKISGDQVNYGVEAMLTGRVARRLVMSGGLHRARYRTSTNTGNAADGRQALRRHPDVEVEPADGIPAARRHRHVS